MERIALYYRSGHHFWTWESWPSVHIWLPHFTSLRALFHPKRPSRPTMHRMVGLEEGHNRHLYLVNFSTLSNRSCWHILTRNWHSPAGFYQCESKIFIEYAPDPGIDTICTSSTPFGFKKRVSQFIGLFTSKIPHTQPTPEVNDLDACRIVAFPSLSSCATRPLIMFVCRQPLSIKADIDIFKL